MGALPSSSFIECSHCPWPLSNWGSARGAGGRVLLVELGGRGLILTLPGSGSEFPLL